MTPITPLYVSAAIAVLTTGNAITSISAYSEGRSMPARQWSNYHDAQQQDFMHGTGRTQGYYNNNNNDNFYNQNYGRSNYNNYGEKYYQPEYQGYYHYAEMDSLQGQSRRSYDAYGQRSEVTLATEYGRPLDATVGMWDGPDNTSHQTRFWSEDGRSRPFQTSISNSASMYNNNNEYGDYYNNGNYNTRNTMDIYNKGSTEYPLQAAIQPEPYTPPPAGYYFSSTNNHGETIQGGGTVKHFQINPNVSSARISITSTTGTPIQALVELLQGPGRVAQLAEVYDEHGETFSTVVQTPGYGSTIAVRNDGPMEYPIEASVEPVSFDGQGSGGGGGGGVYGYGGGSVYGNARGYGGYY